MSSPAFDNSYARLPTGFFAPAPPHPAPAPRLLRLNQGLAVELGLDAAWLASDEGLSMLSGRGMPDGAEPIAMAYAGHQFGGWVPQLGDGRASLLGEVCSPDGRRFDIQLKGSGPTRFSRAGDGKAVLGPVMREYVVSEAMAAMGVPSTRALAAVTTGERIFRNGPEPGAVLTRVAQSHVRVGTFQYFHGKDDDDAVRTLADYVIERHFPEAQSAEHRYRAFVEEVIRRQVVVVAHWMALGFIHGVMNTDNMQVVGETIDYGPCAFMDAFHPQKKFSSIDQRGRYAWGNQPGIAVWNLSRFAETMLPLLDPDPKAAVTWAEGAIGEFRPQFAAAFGARWRAKLGLLDEVPGHQDLIDATLVALTEGEVDFTLFFRHLTRIADGGEDDGLRALFSRAEIADDWLTLWRQQLATDGGAGDERVAIMRRHNPIFIPRNHRVEEAIVAGVGGDYAPFHRLADVLQHPFDEQPEHAELELPPAPHEVVERTFCGT